MDFDGAFGSFLAAQSILEASDFLTMVNLIYFAQFFTCLLVKKVTLASFQFTSGMAS